jgi:signal transduction histidine kinase
VTAEIKALEAAQRALQQLDNAIESSSEGFALFDAQDRLVFANSCFREIYSRVQDRIVPGTKLDELVRFKFESGLFAPTGAKIEDRIRWYTDLHRDPHDSHEIQLSDGRWLRMSDRRTPDGGIVSVRTDITELKRRERALVQLSDELSNQNLRFEAALNNMIQGLCMFDSEQRLIVCNERYLEMYGFSPEVVKPGISLKEIMEYSVSLGNYRSEDAAQAIAERPWYAARREQATLYQRLTDGRIMAVMHQPMRGGGSVATYEDVTQTVRAEEALREYASRLERSNQELQDFASVASHDLQEPLRKIEAFSDRLMAKCSDELSESATLYLERMRDAAGRMRLLINGLLSYSRVTSRARPFVPVDVGTIASEVVSDLQIAIEQSEGQVEFRDLPEIEGDATQIRQLLQNLIANALKFRAEGKPPVISVCGRILEEPSQLDGSLGLCELTIADNGIGFEQKYAERIFGIFQRLHGRNEYEGTGIGLATCRKIVERHGGSIEATGVPGKGATFTITLPVKQPHGEPVQ